MPGDLTQYATYRGETKPKTQCPICGHDFIVEPGEIRAANTCPRMHSGGQSFAPEELITEDDDYAWVL